MALTIQNVVSTMNMGCKLRLDDIGEKLDGAKYDPKHFNAVVYKMKDPKATFLMFSSGKIICNGVRSKKLAKEAVTACERNLENIGYETDLKDFKVTNMVGSTYVGYRIRIDELSDTSHKFMFEPELFAGMSYKKDKSSSITVIAFFSGKVIVTGGKTENELQNAMNDILPTFAMYEIIE
jgi:transcription initiation factor TFIID TATA-box-binding protein